MHLDILGTSKIGNNVIIIPGSVVDRDITDDVIYSKGKII